MPNVRKERLVEENTNPRSAVIEPVGARDWARVIGKYGQPINGRASFEIMVTLIPFVALWVLTWLAMDVSYWLSLLIAIPAGVFLVRMFMIQHDCGHGSFFRQRQINDWTGRIIGVLTLTPYGFWKRTHALHHANSGNLDRRGHGDVETLTVAEYRNRSALSRLAYRLYRHPLVMFTIGPIYLFMLQHRLPVGLMRRGWRPWISAMGTNLFIVVAAGIVIYFVGLKAFLMVHLPITFFAGMLGVWLFFVQHQFAQASWDSEGDWDWHEAALQGSSYYELPGVLRWLTADIGVHHVHHLCGRVPFYRLAQVLRDHPQLRDISRITLAESLGCVRLALWDESHRRMVSFREYAKAS